MPLFLCDLMRASKFNARPSHKSQWLCAKVTKVICSRWPLQDCRPSRSAHTLAAAKFQRERETVKFCARSSFKGRSRVARPVAPHEFFLQSGLPIKERKIQQKSSLLPKSGYRLLLLYILMERNTHSEFLFQSRGCFPRRRKTRAFFDAVRRARENLCHFCPRLRQTR